MVLPINQDNMLCWVALVQALSTSRGEEDMIKKIQVTDVSNLCTSQSMAAVAKYVHSCVADKMRLRHIPDFVFALKGCLAQPDNTTLSKQLHAAATKLASKVTMHLELIEYITAQARAHASPDTPAVVLTKMTTLRRTYLSTVSTQLLTCAQADLQQVLARFFAARLSELCDMSGADLISSLHAAEAAAAETTSARGEASWHASAQPEHVAPPEVKLTNLAPATSIPLPQEWLQGIYDVVDALVALQLPAQVLEVLSAAVRRDVHNAISALGKDWLFVPVLAAVEQYVAAAPLLLLRHLLPRTVPAAELQEAEQQECLRLQFFLYDTLGRLYVDCMFDIMMAYPDSEPAAIDFAECMKRTSLHRHFVDSLLQALHRRLLHPGVATENILDAHINAIKVLQCIDKSGVLLEAATLPIKSYLRSRPDTIRCVVRMLTQEDTDATGGSLLTEVREPAVAAEDCDEIEGPDAVLQEAEAWVPTPIELDNARLHDPSSFDIITTLVDIYGDALFVAEYKRMLGSKLIKKSDFDTDFETQTLELLKLRFLESELHHCDVMLKDIQQSRRHVQALLHPDIASAAKLEKLQPHLQHLSVLICSRLFWPELPAHDLQLRLPDWARKATEAHAMAFHLAKAPRKLEFAPALGIVELELVVGSATLNFSVSPVLAAIILPFQEHESMSAVHLEKATNIPMELLLRKALFWVQQGVLIEARLPGGHLQYCRAEKLPDSVTHTGAVICEEPEDEDAQPACRQQAEADNGCQAFLHEPQKEWGAGD
eukprot:jgi/Ulvmu1/5366/UM022_0160.1